MIELLEESASGIQTIDIVPKNDTSWYMLYQVLNMLLCYVYIYIYIYICIYIYIRIYIYIYIYIYKTSNTQFVAQYLKQVS